MYRKSSSTNAPRARHPDERAARQHLHDQVSRTPYGVLKTGAYDLQRRDDAPAVKRKRMGINLGLIDDLEISTVNELFIQTQPALPPEAPGERAGRTKSGTWRAPPTSAAAWRTDRHVEPRMSRAVKRRPHVAASSPGKVINVPFTSSRFAREPRRRPFAGRRRIVRFVVETARRCGRRRVNAPRRSPREKQRRRATTRLCATGESQHAPPRRAAGSIIESDEFNIEWKAIGPRMLMLTPMPKTITVSMKG